MAENDRPEWLTVADVARRLQVSEETVRRWIRAGELPVLSLDPGTPRAGYRIRESDLEHFYEGRYGPVGKAAA